MKNDPDKLPRFTAAERTNHWLVAINFFLAALSGLVFFHPFFFNPLSLLFNSGTWARILHPFFGVAMIFLFGAMFFRFRGLCAMTPSDWEWLGHLRDIINGDERNMPPAGKLNGGQKMLFWLQTICMVLLILSGIVIWRAYFSFLFPLWLVRFSAVVHAAAGWVMVLLIIGHIYMAIWTRESMDAMLHGLVRRAWAKQHHPLWFREMSGGGK
ncbi:MAG TPA: formate dehydrogenase subunit gamma [Desulfuromonadaceae bacterium]